MESVDVMKVGIGEDKPLEAKQVVVVQVGPEDIKATGTERIIGTKVVLSCQHPDMKEKAINISSTKFVSGGVIKQGGLWFKLDDSGKIPPRSALAKMMTFYHAKYLPDLIGMKVDTVLDDAGYLVVKAY